MSSLNQLIQTYNGQEKQIKEASKTLTAMRKEHKQLGIEITQQMESKGIHELKYGEVTYTLHRVFEELRNFPELSRTFLKPNTPN